MGTRKRGRKLENRGNSGWRGYEVEERECRTGKKMGGGGENEREGVRIGRQREEGKNPVKG